jgi:hypothetical protein
MLNSRVKIRNLLEGQLPEFLRESYPEFQQLLTEYYKSSESQGAPLDLLNNIDQYVKIDNLAEITYYSELSANITENDDVILVDSTDGFPNNYGLLQINDEIISYESKTNTSFVNCSRGFSGITSYRDVDKDTLIFSTSNSDSHFSGSTVYNLSNFFLRELFKKFKSQYVPGFDNIDFFPDVNEKLFISKVKDFYSSKGAITSFEILFKALYGQIVKVVKPKDFIIQPSDADYRITRDLVVEQYLGNPENLLNLTLFQDQTESITKASGTITKIEKIYRNSKEYYQLSLDYNPDIEEFEFTIHPKTAIVSDVTQNQTYLDVDSTLGFPTSGVLSVKVDGLEYLISYSDKSSTQFLGCADVPFIPRGTRTETLDYAYAIDRFGNEVRVKVTGVISSLDYNPEETYYYRENDEIQLVSLGRLGNKPKHNEWIFNITPTYDVVSITQLTNKINGAARFRLVTKDENIFTVGDPAIIKSNTGLILDAFVISVSDKNTIDINLTVDVDKSLKYTITKDISKVNCINYPELNVLSSDVQNVYIDKNDVYVTSASLPNYYNVPLSLKDYSIVFSGEFNGEDLVLGDHPFYTGDSIFYKSQSPTNKLNIEDGIYYVKKVNESTIKLASSKSNLYNDIFISLFGTISDNKIQLSRFYNLSPKSQKLVRKISDPVDEGISYETESGQTGILKNGVEILNYKSNDFVYYGEIEDLKVTSSGDSNYDVISPPILHISDAVGSGATGVCNVVGSLKRINIIDGGYGYISEPKITIIGGNGFGASAKANLISITNSVKFNAGDQYDQVNLSNSTIGFTTDHRFFDTEQVVYKCGIQTSIGGLTNDSIYYVGVIDRFTINLYSSLKDSISGINTISFTSYGDGLHTIDSFEKRKKISSIDVISSGENYQNKTLFFNPSDVNIYSDTITIKNHRYKDKEIVNYNSTQSLISGLSSTTDYYVKVIDNDHIKLSLVGIGTSISEDFYFNKNRFISLGTKGTGIHKLIYKPITISIESPVGITTFSGQDFDAKVQAIFRGNIDSISLSNKGKHYGDEEIINYNRQPLVTLLNGDSALITPIVSNTGQVIDAIINNRGFYYNSPPELIIDGDGVGCILTPVIKDGKIVEVKIINTGFGYNKNNTFVRVVSPGSGAKFEAQIKNWRINLVERLIDTNQIRFDDGVLSLGKNERYGLQYCHPYIPRELRRKSLSTSLGEDGTVIYRNDILNDDLTLKYHSPIIGWAYDGNPIYGPYGYGDREGGLVKRMTSGYSLRPKPDRPSSYPIGLFVEDYEFSGEGDLDIYNGRYCKTPEFPNGVYAYFSTINAQKDSSGIFNGFLRPVFPYFIGNYYKSNPIRFNFDLLSNQDFIDINQTKWLRNTTPYSVFLNNSYYDGFVQPDKFIQNYPIITSTVPGFVDELKVVNFGDNYSINDNIFFNNEGSSGSGAYASIKEISGRSVQNIVYNSSVIDNVEIVPYNNNGTFIGFATEPHNLSVSDLIRIQNLSNLNTQFDGIYKVGITTNQLTLTQNIPDSSITGIVTYINVIGTLTIPDLSVNDVLGIGTEKVKVLEVDTPSSRIKVRREYDSTLGVAHSQGITIQEYPRKFFVNIGLTDISNYKLNKELYFYPAEAISIPSENVLPYSNPVDFSNWSSYVVGSGSTVTVTYYNHPAPNNTISAAKVQVGVVTSTEISGILNGPVTLSSDDYTISVFLKGQFGGEIVYLIVEDGSNFIAQQLVLTSSWKRYSVSGTTNAGPHDFFVGGWGPQGYTIPESTFYIWGAQIESGNVLTPYIKTESSIVLRADNEVGTTYFSNPGFGIKEVIIPQNSIYLPGHNLNTGDTLIYKNNGNNSIQVSFATTTFPLANNSELFAVRYSDTFIGISTIKVGLGTTGSYVGIGTTALGNILTFSGYGTGLDHSFVTNYDNIISGDIYRKDAVVTTDREHGLRVSDIIDINVISGIQTTVYISYDDLNRRLLVNPRSFTALNVDTNENTISILNHGFELGSKVIHNSQTPTGGLNNAQIYYIIPISENLIKLSNNYYSSILSSTEVEFVDLTSASFGTLTPINPEIKAIANSTVIFDLSDQSLSINGVPSFDFNLYTDSQFKNKFFNTQSNLKQFNVFKSGTIGIDGGRLTLIIDENVPKNLYYTLTPINYDGASAAKLEYFEDDFNVKNNNKFSIVQSEFSKRTTITGVTTNTFRYSLVNTPEKSGYTVSEGITTYFTNSPSAIGPVYSTNVSSKGRGYRKLPTVVNISSGLGTNAIFLPASKTLGKASEVEITDIGFDYPVDYTLRPYAKFPNVFKIEPLSKFKEIKIISPGVNYFVPPQLLVLDGFTGRVNDEVDLRYQIGDIEVTIVRNTTGLYNVKPVIIPINNPNGTRISNISYNSTTKEVTVGLGISYTSEDQFPFIIGEKVIVENTNIDLVEGGRGYNSANYGYVLFEIIDANSNIGVEEDPFIVYSLQSLLGPNQSPGIYDSFESFGTVTPERYFPSFDIKLEKDSFRVGEIVTTDSGSIGVVQNYDQANEYLKIRTKYQFKVNDLIVGASSGNKGVISSVEGAEGIFDVRSNSITRKGWQKQTGYLSDGLQRIHDNDYYQYFSYSLKSPVSYEIWNPVVSNLNHTAGFKKFGELSIESFNADEVGISTSQDFGALIAISDLVEVVDLNCVKDFDVAREKSILIDETLVSNEIIFRLPFLQRYQEFIGNRVLKIDDISNQFDNNTRSFDLYSNNYPIFKVQFNASDPNIVDLADASVNLINHYFVSGEEVEYIPQDNDFNNAIEIVPTFISGIGVTTKLPPSIYVIKVDNQRIRFASSPENALLFNPVSINLTSVGIGSTHIFKSKIQNTKALITINGTIQTPIVGTAITSALSNSVGIGSTIIGVVGISSFFGGDLIQINEEIMKITAVSSASTTFTVLRSWMGTVESSHNTNDQIIKLSGTYNIIDNTINFIEPMWGNLPIGFGTTATSSGEIDYAGLTTSSRFSGRVFIRSALNQAFTTSFVRAYETNYIFDDISDQFNGITTQFTLKQNSLDVDGLTAGNAVILIDDIFQGPQRLGNVLTNILGDYKIEESAGVSTLGFTGNIANYSLTQDINVNRVPKGGVIVSVGSSNGFGYQPLVSAGGTAIVSIAGTIQSISIGNSGSGYRVGIQTIVNIGVQTYSSGTPNITFVGYATVLNGNVVGPVVITNPGSGFTSSNPPEVIFDDPLSYSNIPLIYSSDSPPNGIGTGAIVDIVVGQGSSVINFEFKNYGYAYGQGDILTVPVGGLSGIPTSSGLPFNEFKVFVDSTYRSKFSGWNVGDFLVLDNIEQFFNGRRRLFPLSINGERISFFARQNSGIDLQSNLLVFVNDILQTPGEGYTFTGGSVLRFSEAPKGGIAGISTKGDRCKLLIYTGTQTIDVKQVDVLPTVKIGDEVQLYNDTDETLNQEDRLVIDISAADTIITNNYAGQGVVADELFERPISWCKQTVDKIIDENEVAKDRIYYEPAITPSTNILHNVGLGSTAIFVSSLRPFFDYPLEGISIDEKTTIELVSQEDLVTATAEAIISVGGTVSSISVTNPGFGYTVAPMVTIQSPGYATSVSSTATGIASISSGIVTSIQVSFGGTGYVYGPVEALSISAQGLGFPRIDPSTNRFIKAKLKSKTGIGVNATATITLNPFTYNITTLEIIDGGYNYQLGDQLFIDTFDNVGLASTQRKYALTRPMEFTVSAIKPPVVLVSPPARKIESIFSVTYSGDYGNIVGVGTTNVGISTGVVFDFYIPLNSILRRDYSIFTSGIQTGQYFVVTDSSLGNSSVSLTSSNGVLGIGSTCLDNVYEVISTSLINRYIPSDGITTSVVRVVTKIANYNGLTGIASTAFYGNYSWGRIDTPIRTRPVEFNIETNQFVGISSNPIVRRAFPLKYLGYIV